MDIAYQEFCGLTSWHPWYVFILWYSWFKFSLIVIIKLFFKNKKLLDHSLFCEWWMLHFNIDGVDP